MSTTEDRQLGRAKNAVLDLLQKRLAVPRVYLNAAWDGAEVDVLAIDRDGVGDVHVVLMMPALFIEGVRDIVREANAILATLERLAGIHAQYKYIAVVNTRADNLSLHFGLSSEVMEKTFSGDGLGRVGFILVETSGDAVKAGLEIKPERFRAFITEQADEFVRDHAADWQVRLESVFEEAHV